MLDRRSITSGMTVRGPHGERLGWVAACGEHTLQINAGRMFHHHFVLAPYGAVVGIEHGEVRLDVGAEQLQPGDLHDRHEVRTYVLPVVSLEQLHSLDPTRAAVEPPYHASGPHEGPGAGPEERPEEGVVGDVGRR